MSLCGDLTQTSSAPLCWGEMPTSAAEWPLMICILGSFRLLKKGRPISIRSGSRAEILLGTLGLKHPVGVERESLLDLLWPSSAPAAAGHSINSLVCTLHRQLGDSIGGASPIVLVEGHYRLNSMAGVGLDLAYFGELIARSVRDERAGDYQRAMAGARAAVQLYRGDLSVAGDDFAIVHRERTRALYLSALARLADRAIAVGDYLACLDYTTQLLSNDPYREDAHRIVMRCYLKRGERSQALRQYHLCAALLRREFDAIPEPETVQLYNDIRLNPGGV